MKVCLLVMVSFSSNSATKDIYSVNNELIDISYNIWNDMYVISSVAIGAEIVINIVCLNAALCLWYYLYKHRDALMSNRE